MVDLLKLQEKRHVLSNQNILGDQSNMPIYVEVFTDLPLKCLTQINF